MSKSSRLDLSTIRDVFHLVGDCCELGADPVAWRTLLLEGIARQLRCKLAIGGRADLSSEFDREAMVRSFGDVGWSTANERRPYYDWISTGRFEENPVSAQIAASGTTRITAIRRDFQDDAIWYRAPLVQALRETARVDDVLFSFSLLDARRFLLLVGQRECGDRRFTQRDRQILELITDEVRRRLGGQLESFDAPSVTALPPKLRGTLRCLLEGDSEKQIALRSEVSVHAVHEHVKRLHRHFNVSSRGELLAKCRRFWPILSRNASGT